MSTALALSQARALVETLEALEMPAAPPALPPGMPETGGLAPAGRQHLAWGARVSPIFRERLFWLCDDLLIDPDDMMTCMAWESGRSFRPDIRNMAGSGATGLIQFMPSTALPYFNTAAQIRQMTDAQKKAAGIRATDALARMTAEDQLNYVWRYFSGQKGKLKSLADIYMAILWPSGVGKPENYVLWDRDNRPTTYRQNAGLDVNRDGQITKAEAAAKVAALKPEGLAEGNIWRAA